MHATTVNKHWKHFILLSVALLILAVSGYGLYWYFFHIPNLADNPTALAQLQQDWKNKNIVVLIRHAERCDKSEHPCILADGHGLTVIGKKNAIQIGQDFKQLLTLDNTTIYNSPAMRTTQTRQFMFGEQGEKKQWLKDCKTDLLKNIFKYKKPAKNLILVTHSTCFNALKDSNQHKLLDIKISGDTSYGFAAFIKVIPDLKETQAIGYLYRQDWQRLISP